MKTVLFVDDEPYLLRSLQRSLRHLRHDWQQLYAGSAAEALALIRQQPDIAVVISDYRMPGMNGDELLRQLHQQYPAIVRVMLTGQPDRQTYTNAIALCHYFLWKPADTQVIEQLLARINQLDSLLGDPQLIDLLNSLTGLPTLPAIYQQLLALLDEPENDLRQLASLVRNDSSLCLQVLRLVNSAFFGLVRHIYRIEDALNLLGRNCLRSLVLGQQLFGRCDEQLSRDGNLQALWQHSLLCAQLAEQLLPSQADARTATFTAFGGLLHDIGKLVIACHLPDQFRQIQQHQQQGLSASQAEQGIIGTDHAAIGGYLALLWGLPHALVEAIALHEQPDTPQATGFGTLATAVWHANRIARGNWEASLDHVRQLPQAATLLHYRQSSSS